MCVGGPALIVSVTPTEEELFKVRLRQPCLFEVAVTLCIETDGSGIIRSCRNDRWRTGKKDSRILTISLGRSRSIPNPVNQVWPTCKYPTHRHVLTECKLQYGRPQRKMRRVRKRTLPRSKDGWRTRFRNEERRSRGIPSMDRDADATEH